MSDIGTTGSTGGAFPTGNGQTPGDRDAAHSLKETAAAAASTVKQEAASFASSVKDQAQHTFEDKKQVATKTMADFAGAIRHAGEELAQNDQSAIGRVVKHAADGLEQVTRTISEKRPEELLEAVRDFGRRNPVGFIATTILLGVALGRIVRSSEPETTGTYVPPQAYRPQDTMGLQAEIMPTTADSAFDATPGTGYRPTAGTEI